MGPAPQAAATAARRSCVRPGRHPSGRNGVTRAPSQESGREPRGLQRELAEGPHRRPGQAEAGNRGFKPGLNLCVRSQSCWMWGGGRGRMGWPAPHPRVEPRSSPVGGPGAGRKCSLSPDFLAALSRSIHSLGVCLEPEQSCGRWGLQGCLPGTTGHGTGSEHGNCVLALCGI